MQNLLKRPFHPLVLAIYPVLALFNLNASFLNFSLIFRSLVLSLVGTIMVWAVFNIFTRDWKQSSIYASLFLVAFYSYGHIFNLLQGQFGNVVRHRYVGIVLLSILVALYWLLRGKKSQAGIYTKNINMVTSIMFLLAIFTSSANWYGSFQANQSARASQELLQASNDQIDLENLPDIYYVVLDSYGRTDLIKELTEGYDNSWFIEKVEALGFYVAECSQANYSHTSQSLTSTFYLDYLENVVDEGIVIPSWGNSTMLGRLRGLGYTTYAFESRSAGHYDLNPDILLSRNTLLAGEFTLSGGINEFESLLINTTLIRLGANIPTLSSRIRLFGNAELGGYYEHYLQSIYILDQLPNLANVEGPKIVLAHIIVPHSPYVFTPEGKYDNSNPGEHLPGYANNVEFLNRRIPEILNEIIKESATKPIIILQGDHGPTDWETSEQRMGILNAYYVNTDMESELYPSISPVNSFRLISNHYFGSDYQLLDDRSYYFLDLKREDFRNAEFVPNNCLVN